MTDGQQDVIRHVLGHYGHAKGFKAGRFTSLMMEAMECADPGNLAKLASVFPDYAAAMYLAGQPGGLLQLERMLDTRPVLSVVKDEPPKE